MIRILRVLLLVILFSHTLSTTLYETLDESVSLKGKDEYEKYLRAAKSSSCIQKVVEGLLLQCRDIDDLMQSRLALQFTNCHLLKSNKPTFPCRPEEDFTICSSSLSGDAWNTYTAFYTHAQSICFYYRSLNWQETTENTINVLSYYSAKLSDVMSQNYEKTAEMYAMQSELDIWMKENLKLTKETAIQLNRTNREFENLNHRINSSYTQIISNLQDQGTLFAEFFKGFNTQILGIKEAQYWIISQFFDVQSLLYYAFVILASFFLTSFQKLSEARIYCLMIVLLNYLMERSILYFTIEFGHFKEFNYQLEQNCKSTIRYFSLLLIVLVLLNTFRSYRDATQLVLLQLERIEKQQDYLNQTPVLKRKIKQALYSLAKDSLKKLKLKKTDYDKQLQTHSGRNWSTPSSTIYDKLRLRKPSFVSEKKE